jgi:hypothetical protein
MTHEPFVQFIPTELDRLNRDQLSAWLHELLLGQNATIKVRPDTYQPAELLATVFFSLRGETRELIQRIIVGFLRDLVRNENSHWASSGGKELIRSVALVLFDAHRDEAWNLIREITASPERFTNSTDNCHLAALQAILELRFRGTFLEFGINSDFWAEVPISGPFRRQYMTTVLEGMARADPKAAIDWLNATEPDVDSLTALAVLMPTFARSADILSMFEDSRARLHVEYVEVLDRFRAVLETPEDPDRAPKAIESITYYIDTVAEVVAGPVEFDQDWWSDAFGVENEDRICQEILQTVE